MIKKLRVCFLMGTTLVACTGWAANKFPVVSQVRGQNLVTTGMTPKSLKPSKGLVLQTRATLKSEADSEIKIRWDAKRTLTLLPGSEILVPAISYETGEAPVILLKTGSIHWEGLGGEPYKVALRSDLFEFIAPSADFVLIFDPAKAYAEVKVNKGRLEFSALNGETSALVQSGQKVGFQGVLEEGQIAYDILLKGKKIPRGQLTPVRSLGKDDLTQSQREQARLKKEAAAAQAAADKKAALKKTLNQICSSPAAKFNQCSWICEGNPKGEKTNCQAQKAGVQCVRSRCNANGEWSDRTVLDKENAQSLCKASPIVGPCNY